MISARDTDVAERRGIATRSRTESPWRVVCYAVRFADVRSRSFWRSPLAFHPNSPPSARRQGRIVRARSVVIGMSSVRRRARRRGRGALRALFLQRGARRSEHAVLGRRPRRAARTDRSGRAHGQLGRGAERKGGEHRADRTGESRTSPSAATRCRSPSRIPYCRRRPSAAPSATKPISRSRSEPSAALHRARSRCESRRQTRRQLFQSRSSSRAWWR